eukprot:1162087-Pelagomonas_calceolata.AAC.7
MKRYGAFLLVKHHQANVPLPLPLCALACSKLAAFYLSLMLRLENRGIRASSPYSAPEELS